MLGGTGHFAEFPVSCDCPYWWCDATDNSNSLSAWFISHQRGCSTNDSIEVVEKYARGAQCSMANGFGLHVPSLLCCKYCIVLELNLWRNPSAMLLPYLFCFCYAVTVTVGGKVRDHTEHIGLTNLPTVWIPTIRYAAMLLSIIVIDIGSTDYALIIFQTNKQTKLGRLTYVYSFS